MSDQPDRDPELTPEQEATVRRLLAGARHDEPVPGDVGARLDRVLADLSGAPSASSAPTAPTAPVVDLAAHRRRRNAGALLVAAAAVIVGGFAVGQAIDVGGSSDDAGSADSSVARDGDDADAGGGQALSASPGDPGDAGDQRSASAMPDAAQTPLLLTSGNLKRDVKSQLNKSGALVGAQDESAPLASASTALGCATAPPAAYGVGTFFAAFYDGTPTVLALRPPDGTTQQAQVLDCGTGTPLQSVTVPAP